MDQVELNRANEKTVRALLDHLTAAFEEFCRTYPGPVDYIDGFMAAHNFHCVIVLDLERRLKADPERQLFWRRVAVDTFKLAMENKPAFSQEENNGEA